MNGPASLSRGGTTVPVARLRVSRSRLFVYLMIKLPYSLIIEATADPDFFGFYSSDLEGFTGIGHSVEDCLYQARWGMADHVQTLLENKLDIPPPIPTRRL